MNGVSLASTNSALVVFSVSDPTSLKRLLDSRHIPYQRVVGCYEGQMEYSFVVRPEVAEIAAQEGHLDDQTCVLYLSRFEHLGERRAWFVYTKLLRYEYKGVLRPVLMPAPNEDYTYADKAYWCIRPDAAHWNVAQYAIDLSSRIMKRLLGTVEVVGA